MESKDYWNMVADRKAFTTPFRTDLFVNFVDNHSLILDIGCGYGRVMKELFDLGYRSLIGIDISYRMIEIAKAKYPYLSFQVINTDYLQFSSRSIDVVLLISVLTTMHQTKAQEELIKEVYRVLKPGGILFVNDFLINDSELYKNRYQQFSRHYGEYGVFESSDGGIFRHHTKEHLDKLFSNFKTIYEKVEVYDTLNGNRSNGLCYIGQK